MQGEFPEFMCASSPYQCICVFNHLSFCQILSCICVDPSHDHVLVFKHLSFWQIVSSSVADHVIVQCFISGMILIQYPAFFVPLQIHTWTLMAFLIGDLFIFSPPSVWRSKVHRLLLRKIDRRSRQCRLLARLLPLRHRSKLLLAVVDLIRHVLSIRLHFSKFLFTVPGHPTYRPSGNITGEHPICAHQSKLVVSSQRFPRFNSNMVRCNMGLCSF